MDKVLANTDVIILCGGRGTRLSPVVHNDPKSLVKINSYPFIFYILKQISDMSLHDCILCTGYKSDMLKREIKKNLFDLDIQFSEEENPLDTGGAARLGLEKAHKKYVLIMNGDSYVDANLRTFFTWFNDNDFNAGMLLTKVNDTSRFGRVVINEENRVLTFEEKGRSSGAGLINAGITLIKRELFLKIPLEQKMSLEKYFYPHLVSNNDLFGVEIAGRFIDIGTPESFEEAGAFFKEIKLN